MSGEDEEKYQELFLNLIASMEFSALQNLGKEENPMTNDFDVDLDMARDYIDLLEMLKIKTKNNLLEEESSYLNNVLQDLNKLYKSVQKRDNH